MGRTVLSTVALATAAVTVLAGCGSQAPAASSTATRSATAAASATTTFTKPAKGGAVDAKSFGAAVSSAVAAEKSYRMSLTSPAEQTALQVSVQQDGAARNMAISAGQTSMRIVDGSIYVQVPPSGRVDGRSWIGIEKNSKSPFAPMMTAALSSMTALADGTMQRDVLSKATITFVGDELDGAHYRAVVPATAVIDQLEKVLGRLGSLGAGGASGSGFGSMPSSGMAQLRTKLAGKNVVLDYWIDGRGRPVVVSIDASALAHVIDQPKVSRVAAPKMTARYSGWGAPVTVAKPPASEVMPIEQAMVSMMRSGMGRDGMGWSSAPSAP